MKLSTAGRYSALNKTITVEVDDPAQPRLLLKVKANVVVELGFTRTSLRFGSARVGQLTKQKVDLLQNTKKPVKLGEVSSTVEGMSAVLMTGPPKTKDGGQKHALEVSFEPKKIGRINGTITLATDHPKYPSLSLRVYGEVRGDISANPSRVTINMSRALTTHLRVSSIRAPFKVKGAKDSEGFLEIEAKKMGDGKSWELDLAPSAKAKAKAGSFSSKIEIKTDDKAQPNLEVPVYFHVPRKAAPAPKPR